MNWKALGLTALIIGSFMGLIVLVETFPIIGTTIIYILLGGVLLVLFGAIYCVAKDHFEDKEN